MFNRWNIFSLRLYVVCLGVSKTNNQIKNIHNNQTKTYTKTDQLTNQQQTEEEKIKKKREKEEEEKEKKGVCVWGGGGGGGGEGGKQVSC